MLLNVHDNLLSSHFGTHAFPFSEGNFSFWTNLHFKCKIAQIKKTLRIFIFARIFYHSFFREKKCTKTNF